MGGMRFGVTVGEDWEEKTKGLSEDVIVNVDMQMVPTFRKALQIPNQTVLSLRPDWVGGKYFGSEVDRIALLKEGIKAGADFVEIEDDMVEHFRDELINLCENEMCGTIIVKYYPRVPGKKRFEEDWEELHGMADYVKFDCRVETYQDCKKFIGLCEHENIIIAGHGERGDLLGALGGLCGMSWGYVALEKVGKVSKLKLDSWSLAEIKKMEELLSIAQPTSNKLEEKL